MKIATSCVPAVLFFLFFAGGISARTCAQQPAARAAAQGGQCPEGMALVPAGEFIMGCSPGDTSCESDEIPTKRVRLDAFCMDATEVTRGEYKRLAGGDPSKNEDCGANCPVVNVSWSDSDSFCKKAGKRLPTEAEWEKAARGGANTKYYWGDTLDEQYLWYFENAKNKVQPVGLKKPNAYGLYDMIGNVWEWTQDCYDGNWYNRMPADNPVSEMRNCTIRVLRGGSVADDDPGYVRVSDRDRNRVRARHANHGFRCARDLVLLTESK